MTRAQVGVGNLKKGDQYYQKSGGSASQVPLQYQLHLNAKGSIQRSFPCYLSFKSYVSSTAADG